MLSEQEPPLVEDPISSLTAPQKYDRAAQDLKTKRAIPCLKVSFLPLGNRSVCTELPLGLQCGLAGAKVSCGCLQEIYRRTACSVPLVHCALRSKHLGILKTLVEEGVDFNEPNEHGASVLACACKVDPSLKERTYPRASLYLLTLRKFPTSIDSLLFSVCPSGLQYNQSVPEEQGVF